MIEKYPDGSWWPNDHRVIERFPLMCRGNTGEVYPNIVSPLCGSIVGVPFGEGQRRAAVDAGFATRKQMADFDGRKSALAANIAGYLYANVSLARSASARTPGLTVDMIDRQMYGLSGAPPYRRGRGDRSLRATMRSGRTVGGALIRPNDRSLRELQAHVDAFVAASPDPASATEERLLDLPGEAAELLIWSMRQLILASAFAATGRSIVERLVVDRGGDGLVNQLTSGLGTIESAQPAIDLWRLGRLVAGSPSLTDQFDMTGCARHIPSSLFDRLESASAPDAATFRRDFAAFRSRHGARGPDEWELASPTWGSDPSIALATIDRLRRAPADRDPVVVGEQLAADRRRLVAEIRARLPRTKRRLFDIGLRAAGEYQAQREATKAAAVRLLLPIRLGLAELAATLGVLARRLLPAPDRRGAACPRRSRRLPRHRRRAPGATRLSRGAGATFLVRVRDSSPVDVGTESRPASGGSAASPDRRHRRVLGYCHRHGAGDQGPCRPWRSGARRHPARADHRSRMDTAVPRRGGCRRRCRGPDEPRCNRRPRARDTCRRERYGSVVNDPERSDGHRRWHRRNGDRPLTPNDRRG